VLIDDYRVAEAAAELHVDPLREASSQAEFQILALSMALELLVCLGVALLVNRQVTRLRGGVMTPLNELLETIRRLGEGDLSARVEPSGPRELSKIGDGLNAMATDLARGVVLLTQARRGGRCQIGLPGYHVARNPHAHVR
jgi:two-component system OmpR family sensor kinase